MSKTRPRATQKAQAASTASASARSARTHSAAGRGKTHDPRPSLEIRRFFTHGTHPFDEVEWERRDAFIPGTDPDGPPTFEQKGVSFPKSWSQDATNIVAQKYFAGDLDTPEREWSAKQLIGRVVEKIGAEGLKRGYFEDDQERITFEHELAYILLHQMASFNSPVWFNIGVEGVQQQASACFILQVEDDLDSILDWYKQEGKIFQNGSGAGVNLSAIRGSMEPLSRGGRASGPVTFMRAADSSAGTITSGGRCLAPWQRVYTAVGPVAVQELADRGEDFVVLSYDPPAGRYKAKTARAWKAGVKPVVRIHTDKGQFDLSADHPVKLSSGEYAPAAELKPGMSLFSGSIDSTHDGHVLVHLRDREESKERLHRLIAKDILGVDLEEATVRHADSDPFNNHPGNLEITAQADQARRHNLELLEREDQRADAAEPGKAAVRQEMLDAAFQVLNAGYPIDTFDQYVAARKQVIAHIASVSQLRETIDHHFGSYEEFVGEVAARNHRVQRIEPLGEMEVYDVEVDCPTPDDKSPDSGHNFLIWDGDNRFGSGIVVANTRRAAKMVILDVDHPDIEDFIWCKAEEEKKARALAQAGFDMSLNTKEGERNWASLQYQNANNSVRVTDEFLDAVENDEDWQLIARTSGEVVKTVKARDLLRQIAEAAWQCADPGVQYDTTINDWHTCPNHSRINASNPCSEYMHVDNSSCNLASINLMKFRNEDGTLNVEAFCHVVRVMFTAQEILISFAYYPGDEHDGPIGHNTRAMRQIGLGYANLGALLMANGLPYDSEEGRTLAAAITALMTGEAYRQSAIIARRMGPFEEYERNREPMLRVLRKHRAALKHLTTLEQDRDLFRAARQVWKEAVELAEEHGVRNAQATVLAPTGCLTPDSMVLTDQGLARLGELGRLDGEQWQDVAFRVQTDEGAKQATKFYVNGAEQVALVRTSHGYGLRGTPKHRLKVVAEDGSWQWRRIGDIQPGDLLPVRLGGMIGKPRRVQLPPAPEPYFAGRQDFRAPEHVTPELAELVGYFMGDGSLHAKGLRFTVADTDPDVGDRIAQLVEELFGIRAQREQAVGCQNLYLNSTALAGWWEAAGFAKQRPDHRGGKGHVSHIPAAIRATNDPQVYGAFIRGLFEADGGAYQSGTVSWTTAHKSFADEVRAMLLALGIATSTTENQARRPGGPCYALRILNKQFAARYAQTCGFMGRRKQTHLELIAADGDGHRAGKCDQIPLSRQLVDELAPGNDELRRNLLQALARKGTVSRHLAQQLYERTGDSRVGKLLDFYFDPVEEVTLQEDALTFDLSVPENVTYIANGLVSHNTISFMMDCDTTGIEPDFALVKQKKLVGGGQMQIVNRTVPLALQNLGYTPAQIGQIVDYIKEKGTVSGAPELDPEHYPVFACAVGDNAIHYMGHVKMLAAVQPFISGAISKTVNLPSSVTVEDIMDLYLEAGRMGIKAISVYRDGTKTAQPLSSVSEEDKEEEAKKVITSVLGDGLLRGERRRVPLDRQVIGRHFKVGQISGYVHVGLFEDGTPGDLFVTVAQAGSTLRGIIDAWSLTFSLALQYGAPLDALVSKLAFTSFEPAGFTNDPEIRTAKSIVDYVVRWMAARFLDESTHQALGINTRNGDDQGDDERERSGISQEIHPAVNVSSETQPARKPVVKPTMAGTGSCPQCGGLMQQTGKCMTCTSCGANTGGCG